MPYIINIGTFNFTDSSYVPQPLEGVYNFEAPFTPTLTQVHSTVDYIFAVTTGGLDVYITSTKQQCAYISSQYFFTTVGGNSDYVYLGTTTSGVYRIGLSTISGTPAAQQDLYTDLSQFAVTPDLTSNAVTYLNADADGVLVVTDSGVDYFKTAGNPQYRSYTSTSGGYKCFLAGNKGYYITVSGVTTSGSVAAYRLNRISSLLTDWALPDLVYYNDAGILNGCGAINDIYVTRSTAADGVGNTLFCATASGVYVIDESNNFCDIYYTTTAG